jgi:hypothetical protein
MDQILGLRPFVPAKDFALSKRFYQALGFVPTHEDEAIAILKLESFSFILQNFYVKELAENCMVQLLVRDVDAWWRRVDGDKLVADFAVKPPRAPTMQSWGMKVGFVFDPSGVLWHVADVPF